MAISAFLLLQELCTHCQVRNVLFNAICSFILLASAFHFIGHSTQPSTCFTELKCLLQKCITLDLNVLSLLNGLNVSGQPSFIIWRLCFQILTQEWTRKEIKSPGEVLYKADGSEGCWQAGEMCRQEPHEDEQRQVQSAKAGRSPCTRGCGPALWEAAWQHNTTLASWQTLREGQHRALAQRVQQPLGCTGNRLSAAPGEITALVQPCWVPGAALCFPGQQRHRHTALRPAK